MRPRPHLAFLVLTPVIEGCCCCLSGSGEPAVTSAGEHVQPAPPPVPDTPEGTRPVVRPPNVLPQITKAVGLGDSFTTFNAEHGPCTGPAAGPLETDVEGTVSIAFCDATFYVVSAPYGVVQSLILQYEARKNLPRAEAESTALVYAPTDREQLRQFTDTLGQEVTVYRSAGLASNLPGEEWYDGHPVGTFSVVLQHLPGDRTYFGAILAAGVDSDDNDPGRVE